MAYGALDSTVPAAFLHARAIAKTAIFTPTTIFGMAPPTIACEGFAPFTLSDEALFTNKINFGRGALAVSATQTAYRITLNIAGVPQSKFLKLFTFTAKEAAKLSKDFGVIGCFASEVDYCERTKTIVHLFTSEYTEPGLCCGTAMVTIGLIQEDGGDDWHMHMARDTLYSDLDGFFSRAQALLHAVHQLHQPFAKSTSTAESLDGSSESGAAGTAGGGTIRADAGGSDIGTNTDYGIIHRDIKLENLTFNEKENRVFVIDGEYAIKLDRTGHAETQKGMGTIGYFPPEYRKKEGLTPAYDYFAVGVCLLQALAKRQHPYVDSTNWRTYVHHELLDSSTGYVERFVKPMIEIAANKHFPGADLSAKRTLFITQFTNFFNRILHFDPKERLSGVAAQEALGQVKTACLPPAPFAAAASTRSATAVAADAISATDSIT